MPSPDAESNNLASLRAERKLETFSFRETKHQKMLIKMSIHTLFMRQPRLVAECEM